MALSRGTAAAIVQIVTRDPKSRKVIDSPLEYIGGTGWAGGFRNTGMILGNAMSIFGGHIAAGQLARVGDFQGAAAVTEDTRRTYGTLGSIDLTPEQAARVCTGIAAVTAKAITAAAAKAAPGTSLFLVAGSDSQDRMGTTIAHTATLLRMKDGSRYVFDWHATLTASNPMLHASTKAFDENEGVLFTVFQEFA
jgi:hypothetical protein